VVSETAHDEGSLWDPVDLDAVLAGDRATPRPTVLERADGIRLLYPGRLNLLMGETESLKSWAAQVAIAQELGHDHFVVVVDFEDTPEGLVERLRALGVSEEAIATRLCYVQPVGRFGDLAKDFFEAMFAKNNTPTLVVVDGVTEAMSQTGLDPSKGPDVAAFYSTFPRWFAHSGAAVVLIDHVAKDRETRGRWAIGSERKLSGLDGAAYGFEVLAPFGRERTGRAKITVSKDRCGYVRQHEGSGRTIAILELKSWPDGGVSATLDVPEKADEAGFRPTYLMERVSKAIQENPRLTSRALRAAVKGKNEAKDLALELLVNEGFVEVVKGDRGARHHLSRAPFRANQTVGSDVQD